MNDNKYNGFASEEQYEAAMNIIKNAIDEYASTIMVEKENGSIKVYIYTMAAGYWAKYWMDKNGVFRVDLDDNEILFGVLNEYTKLDYLYETEEIDDEHFIDIDELNECPMNPLSFKLNDIHFMKDFLNNTENLMFKYDEFIYACLTD